MAEASKDTIYIDVDDEITGIIEKVRASKHKIVALVLPKRAGALQSIVNIKLLKRSADAEHKKVVLITSEAGLMPLAGAVGLYVAKTLQSQPSVPPPPDTSQAQEVIDENGEEGDIDKSKSVGELAGITAIAAAAKPDQEETIDIDNGDDEEEAKPKKDKKTGSKISVPNFDKFRGRLFLGSGALILLIIGWIFAFRVLPKATVTIKTNAVSINSGINFTADTSAKEVNEKTNTVPAVQKESKQSASQKITATGQKNVGEKASGTVSLKNCTAQNGTITIPAGTTVTSSGLSYVTTDSVTLPQSLFSGGGNCLTGAKDVGVSATNPGSNYNISSGKSFAVIGYSGVGGTNGNAFAGGTDKTVTVVSQKDVDDAKKKITEDNSKAKDDLVKQFQDDNLFPLQASILPGKQTVTSSPKVGEEATDVNVTVETNYTMLGVVRDDLKKLVENDVKKHIDTKKQALSDDGLDQASFTVTSKKSATNQTFSVEASATAGTQVDADNLKQQITGKKRGDVIAIVQGLPSVESVTVDYSPFWVFNTPNNPDKITIVVQKNEASSDTSTQ